MLEISIIRENKKVIDKQYDGTQIALGVLKTMNILMAGATITMGIIAASGVIDAVNTSNAFLKF